MCPVSVIVKSLFTTITVASILDYASASFAYLETENVAHTFLYNSLSSVK